MSMGRALAWGLLAWVILVAVVYLRYLATVGQSSLPALGNPDSALAEQDQISGQENASTGTKVTRGGIWSRQGRYLTSIRTHTDVGVLPPYQMHMRS